METRKALSRANPLQTVIRWALGLVGLMVEMMASMTDALINLGLHLAVMLASLRLKDAPRAARSVY